MANDLAGELDGVAAALAAGRISHDTAAAIAHAMARLPKAVEPDLRARAQGFLLEQADQFDPAALHKLGQHLIHLLDPVHAVHADQLAKDDARDPHRQELTLSATASGARLIRGQLGPEGGALLDTLLQAVSAPRPAADATPDTRPAAQRRAEGFLDLLADLLTHTHDYDTTPEEPSAEAKDNSDDSDDSGDTRTPGGTDAPTTGTSRSRCTGAGDSGGEPVTLVVTTTANYLSGDPSGHAAGQNPPARPVGPCGPVSTLPDGHPLSPESARRLGCDAWIVAATLSGGGQPLDIGRATRIVPRHLRRALVLRDQGCAFPGCGRPPRWTHAHHITHWAHGGPTALTNLVLLCGHHHRVVHHHGWTVTIATDGHPRFTPPPWIDPALVPDPPGDPPTSPTSDARTRHLVSDRLLSLLVSRHAARTLWMTGPGRSGRSGRSGR